MHRWEKPSLSSIDLTAAVEIYPGLLSAIPCFMLFSHLPCAMYS